MIRPKNWFPRAFFKRLQRLIFKQNLDYKKIYKKVIKICDVLES